MDQQLKADQNYVAIRLVTERYRELQGLRVVWAGLSFAAAFGTYLFAGAPLGTTGEMIALAVSFAIIIPGEWLLSRYYAAQFGRVEQPAGKKSGPGLWLPVSIGVASSVTNGLFETGPLPAALGIVASYSLWTAIRDWPLRTHHAFAAVCTAAAIAMFFTSDASLQVKEARTFVAFGMAYVVVGFLDHRLLTTTLRRKTSLGAYAETKGPRQD